MRLDQSQLTQFAVNQAQHVAETPLAHIWRVTRANGTPAALKLYKNDDLQDEALGFDFLDALNGQGALRIYARKGAAVLMEWLDGPSLGDIVREGDDSRAAVELVAVANQLHSAPQPRIAGFDPLTNRFRALLDAGFSDDCPDHTKATIWRATDLATQLLEAQTNIQPLHGDLHHDNVKLGSRGYLAFDAKGVLGERTFELANAFRNPLGSEDFYQDRKVIMTRARIWAEGLEVSQSHLLSWAAAYSALSLAWTYEGTFDPSTTNDVKHVDTLLSCAAL